MGFAKSQLMKIEERGYKVTDKCVCSGCIKDKHLVYLIRQNGAKGACDFCKDDSGKPIKHRKVFPLESLMQNIMPAIDYYYLDADDAVPYDKETDEYLGNVTEHCNFIYTTLAEEMQTDNQDLLDELYRIIIPKNRTSVYEFFDRNSKKSINAWANYTELINARNEMSVEQIVSLCGNSNAPDDLKEIKNVLQEVMFYARELYSYLTINPGTVLYRCVNFHHKNSTVNGYDSIPATLIGTAPSKYAENGRFNEKGDMMFYGTSNPEIAMIEVGSKDGLPFTIGEFHTNKRIRVLNLCQVQNWKRPSVFDLDKKSIDKRECWLFLNEYISLISAPVCDKEKSEEYYKPIQVFTKYIQRVTGLYGIAYRSSKSKQNDRNSDYVTDRCYVLFAENRDCMDEFEKSTKMNSSRLQLFMTRSWQKDSNTLDCN